MAGNNRSLTQTIVDELGQAVVCGTYSDANPFPIEAELCEQYDVSRSILREAVKMLTSKGLLRARPRQGTWVQPESSWNLLDPQVLGWLLNRKFSIDLLIEFTEVRRVMEPQAAEHAAMRASDKAIAEIHHAISRMEAAARGDDDPLLSDIAFHVAILDASGNRFFHQLKDLTTTALKISIRFTNQYKGVPLADVEDHRKVANAIADHKPKAARRHMSALLDEAMDLMYQAKAERAEESN
ncbi:FadR/GntR family transcriptional regulator [Agarilytica rhodophyticola]|uniref:FadR/GntR family transcriptional regulator n=1 Tax=Agarilytica rhodophyticola TaxID=1737490 RepID=UPI000B341225|nr:FadR/GntR family transcriptional regulator [Agarilytica rhodophyticola]